MEQSGPRRMKFADPDRGYYHIISRIVQREFRLEDAEKQRFIELLQWLSRVYFVKIATFSLMTTHFHLVVKMIRERDISEKELQERFDLYYNQGLPENQKRMMPPDKVQHYYQKFGDISNFMWDLKVRFSRWYNQVHDGFGHVWAERFTSVMLVGAEALRACMIYVDLNAVRAGLVNEPEKYPYCGLYHYWKSRRYSCWLDEQLLKTAVTCFDSLHDSMKPTEGQQRESNIVQRYLDAVYCEGLNLRKGKHSIPEEVYLSKEFCWGTETWQSVFMRRIPQFSNGYVVAEEEVCSALYQEYKKHFRAKSRQKQGKPLFTEVKGKVSDVLLPYIRKLCSLKTSTVINPTIDKKKV